MSRVSLVWSTKSWKNIPIADRATLESTQQESMKGKAFRE